MADYPRLTEMGILNPEEIDKYLVNGISDYDVLRVIYSREKGSLLPNSRTYKFPRVQKTITEDKGHRKTVVMETNPDLKSALHELDSLLSVNKQKRDVKASLLEQIGILEEEIALRTQSIKDLMKQL